jgi:hypothetical protein
MSNQRNEFTYEKEFVGNLRAQSEPVPVQVNTRLRVELDLAPREIQEYKTRAACVPQYVFGQCAELPLHPSLQATGRHFFNW